jgi:molybdenum cofactor cytidylyltransferase
MTAAAGRHALVLAAGAGRRFGGGKLTADWAGEPLVLAAVRTALKATVETVTVVTGADDTVMAALSRVKDARLRQVEAAEWSEGMAASLRAGIAALPPSATAVVLFLGDMPRTPASLADRLLDAVIEGATAGIIRSPQGPAHPVAFAAAVFPDLLRLKGDRGARGVLEALGDRVVAIPCDDPGVVFDIDRPADLETGAS